MALMGRCYDNVMRDNQPHSAGAYAEIYNLILSGEIAPDTPISTRSLAERTGIGRTPIREALQALARDGVIDIVPMRGTFVRQPDIEEVREIYEVRVALEGMAAMLAAQRGVTPKLAKVGAALIALKATRKPDIDRIRLVGWEFHDELMAAAGNRQLMALYTLIGRKFGLILRQGRKYGDTRIMETLDEHIEIFEAVRAGDAPRAQSLVQAHVQRAFAARIQALSAFPAFPAADRT